jgi:signal transduction histidine kinase
MAIANAEAHAEVERLAAEQAALRRVATLVAEGPEPAAVFDAVAAEMEALLGADQVSLARYEPGDEVTAVAYRGTGPQLQLGARFRLPDQSVTATVRRTERPARIEDLAWADGPIAAIVRGMGLRVSVGAPIVVDGALWGAITASWARKEPPPDDTEERMARFAELLDTAIANADSRDQLAASRARLVTAADEARRRVVRDLHDGAQQRLVHTIVALKLAQRALRRQDGRAESVVTEALGHAEKSNEELRELAHGILPAVLTRGGLPAAVRALTTRLQMPVDLEIATDRVQAEVEASAYFIVAEALTNVAKHAHAQRAGVRASVADGALRVEVSDDGVGGADPTGHGLVGMADRVTALGGRLEIDSPPAGGTRIAASFPLPVEA